jgi:murein DD-endopeptidase MepM/ murein hydrolase activator NlpD
MLKYKLKPFIFFLISLYANISAAQFFPPKNYPRDYFEYPVVATRAYVANFGELRPNHYHMGYDLRTDHVQNKKVVAAADGYIAKVKIEPFGFGRAIYINHSNGLTTLYGHLNGFYTELENYVKQQQYALKSWAVFLDIPSNLFPVKKGDTIALSGNTGGSQGPHLHFEIRDTKTDKVLNPSLFNFQIPDTIAPDIFRLAVYDRRFSTYEQTPKTFALKKINSVYVIRPALIIANTDKVSFGITTSDRYTGSSNRNGVYQTVLYENDNPIVGFQLDSITYIETRYLNAHIDYKLRSSGGGFIEHVSKLPGYNNSIYKTTDNNGGVISLNDTGIHKIKIEVKDANGNTSLVQFDIQRNINFVEPKKQFPASYFQSPVFHPGTLNIFEKDNIHFYLPANCLYDSIHFQYSETTPKQGYTVYQLHNPSVPLQSYFPITIKAAIPLPNKAVMHRFANGKHDYAKAEPVTDGKDSGWYRASFREFGSFQLMIDTVAPAITPIGFKNGMNCSKQSRIAFVVRDNTEEVKFIAMLDGNWLRFTNDKASRFIYEFDEMCPPGEHELKIIAEDQVGNVAEKVYKFTR